VRTTAGTIAISNLDAQIDGQLQPVLRAQLGVAEWAGLIELIALRGTLLSRVADLEWAASWAEQLVHDAPADGPALVTRARMRALLHRFDDALSDVDLAQHLEVAPPVVEGERAAIYQAIGRYDEALRLRRGAVEHRADFESLGALAGLYADRAQIDTAEPLFDEARRHFRGVSPFPLALLDFQRGCMWMGHGELVRARTSLAAACRRVPDYAPAQGHLAEVEAELGEVDAAVGRLLPLTASSDDPDYPAQLARILCKAGREPEARRWRSLAGARYDDLMISHPAAFADHAAAFWLTDNNDAPKALRCARKNFEVRPTPRATELLSRAEAANVSPGQGHG